LLGCGVALALALVVGAALSVLRFAAPPPPSRDARSPQERLVAAVRAGDLAALEAQLAAGGDPDTPYDGNGWTPLLHAVHRGEVEVARALLAAGADPDAPGEEGQRPLLMAAAYGDEAMVELLLDAGADPRLGGQGWSNALEAALTGAADPDAFTLARCQPGTVRLLFAHAPDLAPQGPAGRLGSLFAYVRGCDEVERLLRERRGRD
jgi:hypothetical protein